MKMRTKFIKRIKKEIEKYTDVYVRECEVFGGEFTLELLYDSDPQQHLLFENKDKLKCYKKVLQYIKAKDAIFTKLKKLDTNTLLKAIRENPTMDQMTLFANITNIVASTPDGCYDSSTCINRLPLLGNEYREISILNAISQYPTRAEVKESDTLLLGLDKPTKNGRVYPKESFIPGGENARYANNNILPILKKVNPLFDQMELQSALTGKDIKRPYKDILREISKNDK